MKSGNTEKNSSGIIFQKAKKVFTSLPGIRTVVETTRGLNAIMSEWLRELDEEINPYNIGSNDKKTK